MKKVVRTVWISLLSGLAFLVACTSTKGLTRSERKQLKTERTDIKEQLMTQETVNENDPEAIYELRTQELALRQRLTEINTLLGDDKEQVQNDLEISDIVTQLDSLQEVIQANEPIQLLYGPPTINPTQPGSSKEQRRHELIQRLEEISQTLKRREGACVYGSPEIIQRYQDETNRLRKEVLEISKQLKDLDNE